MRYHLHAILCDARPDYWTPLCFAPRLRGACVPRGGRALAGGAFPRGVSAYNARLYTFCIPCQRGRAKKARPRQGGRARAAAALSRRTFGGIIRGNGGAQNVSGGGIGGGIINGGAELFGGGLRGFRNGAQ